MRLFLIIFISLILTSCSSEPNNKNLLPTDYCSSSEKSVKLSSHLCAYSIFRNQVMEEIDRYDNLADSERFWFRFIGILIIIFSVSIPFINSLKFKNQKEIVSFVAICIAFLTSLNSFYNWSVSLEVYRNTEYRLKHEVWLWELEARKLNNQDPLPIDKANTEAFKITQKLILESAKITLNENNSFFEHLKELEETKESNSKEKSEL